MAMSEAKRIVQQMQQGFEKKCWSGPALLEVLDGVDAKAASAKPIKGAHSIWELVMHLLTGQQLLSNMISGQRTTPAPDAEWWVPVPEQTEANWTDTLNRLKRGEAEFRNAVASFPDDRLDQPLVEGGSSAYNNFQGHVQHMLYHTGQIMLLKRALGIG
jgi:uncharacterized damage-inducible protein DinB